MKYKPLFISPTYYVFMDSERNYYFTGIFGTVALGPVTVKMTEQEIEGFHSGREKYLEKLYQSIESQTERFKDRIRNDVEKDPDVIQLIGVHSFTPQEKPSLLRKVWKLVKN